MRAARDHILGHVARAPNHTATTNGGTHANTDPRITCPECGFVSRTPAGLASHLGHRHPGAPRSSRYYRGGT